MALATPASFSSLLMAAGKETGATIATCGIPVTNDLDGPGQTDAKGR